MARPRFTRIPSEKREALLQCAAEEFAASGYEAASINRILEGAGVSKGAFYYYFDDKADLAATVLLWVMAEVFDLFERLERPADAAGFWRVLRGMLDEGLAILIRSPLSNEVASRLGLAMARDRALSARLAATPEIVRASAAGIDLWRRGQELGAVRRDLPPELMVTLMQAAKEALMRAYFRDGHAPTPEQLARIADLQFDLYRRISVPAEEDIRR